MAEEAGAAEGVDQSRQITVTLDGEEYALRPDHKAITNIERTLGRSLFTVANQAVSGELTSTDLAKIVVELMRAHVRFSPDDAAASVYSSIKVERAEELIYETGAMRVLPRIAILLTAALTGGYTASGEMKPTR